MLKNYLKIAFRNLIRTKSFSFINIIGLSVGMASALLILLWIYDEYSYDRFHKNKDTLYEVWSRGTYDNKLQAWNGTPKILGPTLKQDYPEVAEISRTNFRWFVTMVGDLKVSSKALITDPSFLTMFSFPTLYGDPNHALDGVYSMAITRKMALKMFGTENALSKVITIDSNDFKITAILKDLPTNSQFDFEYILPWKFLKAIHQDDANWENNSINTYVQLKSGVEEDRVNEKIKDVTKRYSKALVQDEIFLYPISKWRLYSRFENGKPAGGRIEQVRLFGLIATFILLIACINFMNLSTARSEKRAKEVGIRKVTGARRESLIFQFLGESVLVAFIAGLLAFLMVQLALPSFNILVNKQLAIPIDSIYFWIFSLLFILVTGIIAGSYPAFFLSSFKPITVLKGKFKRLPGRINPRRVLVVLQFSFSIILIISTVIVIQQMKHGQERNAGFQGDALLYHWNTGDIEKNYKLLKDELLSSGLASDVTKTSSQLTEQFSSTTDISWPGKDANNNTDFEKTATDQGLVKTAGLKLVQGRDMDLSSYPTDSTAMLLNESAVKVMGFKNPIGQLVKDGSMEYHVIGVISDYIFGSPYEQTRPMVVLGTKGIWLNVIHMRLRQTDNITKAIADMRTIFRKYNPEYPFEYHFVNEDYARKFLDLQQTANLTGLFAILTIFISCLGLFGLATYMAEARIKEIGVRKVLGASVLRITTLLSKDFLTLVVISIIIASPIAWYAMNAWLQGYSYRIDMEWWVFALAAVLSIGISLITVSYQAIRAAMANPVKSLRTE